MATPEEKALHQDILYKGDEIGRRMSDALPFKKGGWFARLMEGYQDTVKTVADGKITVSGGETPDTFTRRWLERNTAKTEAESPVRLIEDTVNVLEERGDQAFQTGQDPRVIAVFYPDSGLRIPESLGLPQISAVERLQEIGRFVTEISDAQREQELRNAHVARPAPAAV